MSNEQSNKQPEEQLHGIAKWTRFCIHNYKITILIAIAFIIAGLWGLFSNQRQDFPAIPANYIVVNAVYPQATAEDVEQSVIIPLEGELAAIDGIKQMRSNASDNFGSIFVELEEFNNLEKKVTKANDIISKTKLPNDAEVTAELIDISGPTVIYALTSDSHTSNELLEYAPQVQQFLRQASSQIKEVNPSPKSEFEIVIEIDAEKANAKAIDRKTIEETLKTAIATIPGGTLITDDEGTMTVSVVPQAQSMEDIENVRIKDTLLKDVAKVYRRPEQHEALTFAGFKKNGETTSKETVYFEVVKKDNGDIITLAHEVAAAVESIHNENVIPENAELTEVYSTAPYIQDQISVLVDNGIIGLVVILLVLLFVINLRAAIVVALILPFAFLIGLFVLPLLGYTLNILTLFALILTLGIVVDNAIVITEGIVHHVERGMKKRQAAIKAIFQLGPAVTAATLTTIIVFIPFARLGGITGEFMKFIPYTIIIMLVGSYFLAITMTPALAALILSSRTKEERHEKKMKLWQKLLILPPIVKAVQCGVDKIKEWYTAFMNIIIQTKPRRALIIALSIIAFFISTAVIAPKLKFEQFPSSDSNFVTVETTFDKNVTQEEKKQIFEKIGEGITNIPHFESYVITQGQLIVILTEPKFREDGMKIPEILEKIEQEFQPIRDEYGDRLTLLAQQQSEGPPDSEFDLEVEFKGNDLAQLEKASTDLEQYIKNQDNIDELVNSVQEKKIDAFDVIPNDEKLEQIGLNPFVLSTIVGGYFGTGDAGSLVTRKDGVSDTIKVEYSKESKDNIDDLKNLPIITPAGPLVLHDIADIQKVQKSQSISRLNGERVASVKTRLIDRDKKADFESDVQNYLSDDKLQEFNLSQKDIQFGGAFAQNQEDTQKLIIVFILSIILVYIILVYQFKSFGQPFLILLTIPLALIGVFPGLKIVGSSINMIAGLGIVALVGIVVNDAIVFIDYYNRIRNDKKYSLKEALVKTGTVRFKPILTTSITTIAGILPLTIRDPFWQGLGTSLIAGLIFSTIGTLVVIPIIMHFFTQKGKIRSYFIKRRGKKARKKLERQSGIISKIE